MTTTEPTTAAKRVVVIPEISIPAELRDRADAALARWQAILPEIATIFEEAEAIRHEYGRAVIEVIDATGECGDDMHEMLGRVTGWEGLWTAITVTPGGANQEDYDYCPELDLIREALGR